MCLTCGCFRPDDRHEEKLGVAYNYRITLEDMKNSARADGLPLREALRNLVDTLREEAGVTL